MYAFHISWYLGTLSVTRATDRASTRRTHLRGKRTNRLGFSCRSGSSASEALIPSATFGASGDVLTISVIGFDMSSAAAVVAGVVSGSAGVAFSLFSDVKTGCLTGEVILRFSRFEAALRRVVSTGVQSDDANGNIPAWKALLVLPLYVRKWCESSDKTKYMQELST